MRRQVSSLPRSVVIFAVGVGITVASVRGETLLWDSNPEPDIAGYRVFFGEVNSSPTMVDVGNVTSRQFLQLVAGQTYFFFLKAYNTSGLESEPSETLTYSKATEPNQLPIPPTISSIPNQTVLEDSATRTANFTINDPDTALSSLTLSASSANTTLIANSSLTLGGSGANRTLSFQPQPDQSGSSVITVQVNDGQASASRSFTVTVNAVNDAPTLTDVANREVEMNGSSGPLPITVSDKETAAGSLTLTAQSSNPGLVPQAGLVFAGSGGNRTITVTPAANTVGQAVITLTVNDGVSSSSDSFTVSVTTPDSWLSLGVEWLNLPMAGQSGTFTAEFDAIASSSRVDSVIGFSDGEASQSSDLAAIIRFNPSGFIDAYDRNTFAASAPIPYSPNVGYHFRVTINALMRTYSVYVTPPGNAERTVADGFRFRVGQGLISRLNNVAARAVGGTVQFSPIIVERTFDLLGSNTGPLLESAQLSQGPGSLNIEENFEGPGYENDHWFELNDPNESFATAQLEGDFALNTRAGSQAYYEVGGVRELNTSFLLMWQDVPWLHTIVDLSDANGEPSAFVWYSDGVLHISHGNARASARFGATPGVPYHFWVEWKGATDGNNGEMLVYVSATELKPLIPIARISAGSGTAVERIHFGGAAPDSPSLLMDEIRISEGAARGFSEL